MKLLKFWFHTCGNHADFVAVVPLDPTREFTSAALFRCHVCKHLWEVKYNGSYKKENFQQ